MSCVDVRLYISMSTNIQLCHTISPNGIAWYCLQALQLPLLDLHGQKIPNDEFIRPRYLGAVGQCCGMWLQLSTRPSNNVLPLGTATASIFFKAPQFSNSEQGMPLPDSRTSCLGSVQNLEIILWHGNLTSSTTRRWKLSGRRAATGTLFFLHRLSPST